MSKNSRCIIHLFLTKMLPTFCYQDLYDVLTMAEQVDEDIDLKNLHVQLIKLVKDGVIERKPQRHLRRDIGNKRRMHFDYVYRRVV